MVYNRTGYAPWSLTREAGVQSATVDGTIEVPQYIQPTIDTGFCDEKGNWKGIKSSDEVFTIDAPHLAIANGAAILAPQTSDRDFIDMTGFSDLFIAIKVTNTGAYATEAVMGPDTRAFANLTPVNPASALRGTTATTPTAFVTALIDSSEGLGDTVWNIFSIQTVLKNQKNVQFKITNNSGGESDIEFAFMRLV